MIDVKAWAKLQADYGDMIHVEVHEAANARVAAGTAVAFAKRHFKGARVARVHSGAMIESRKIIHTYVFVKRSEN